MEYIKLPTKIRRAKHSLYLWKVELQNTDWNKFSQDSYTSVQKYLKPTEQEISDAPSLSFGILASLALSCVLDLIGFATFFVPILGWLFNLFWAPFSSFIIHRLYENTFFTSLNFVEELLPIIDFVPSAVLAWIYTYGPFFNIWFIRIARTAINFLGQKQNVKDLKLKFSEFTEMKKNKKHTTDNVEHNEKPEKANEHKPKSERKENDVEEKGTGNGNNKNNSSVGTRQRKTNKDINQNHNEQQSDQWTETGYMSNAQKADGVKVE